MIARGMFSNFSTGYNFVNPSLIALEGVLDAIDVQRIRTYMRNWNYYDGFHWEYIEPTDKPETTWNLCRRFVNKFVAAELGNGVTFKFDEKVEEIVLPFVDEVWDSSKRDLLLQEMGQMKSVTGDSYIYVHYEPKFINGQPNPAFDDPFDEYENGRIRLFLIPSSICFPRFKDGYDTSSMESCTIMFPMRLEPTVLGASVANRYKIIKYVYTKDIIQIWEDKVLLTEQVNPYGLIPIVHFKNIALAGRYFGLSDLDDVIPLNTELNLKNSDTSEILDYHSAPVTCVFGARVSQLEKGANKVWGGLPKDADVKNIELNSDMQAGKDYRDDIKTTMHEVSGIPKIALGGVDISANISGIALQIAFLPLMDVIKMKNASTVQALKLINKIIIKIGVQEKLLEIPEGIKNKLLYKHTVVFGDMLPKDLVQELEQLQQEFKLALTSREDAMERLKKDNIQETIKKIDKEREEYPFIYGMPNVALASGQILVNPVDGSKLADNPAPTPPANGGGILDGSGNPLKAKPVGKNSEGQDMKINSGLTNTNPGNTK